MLTSSSASTHRSRREYSTTSSDYRSSSSPEPAEEEPRFMTFEALLQASRGFFIAGPPVPNLWSNRHLTKVSFRKYQQLCLRGFLVKGMLVLDDPGFAEARSIVENVGWMYTVLHGMPIPIVEQPHTWEDGDLSQAIAFLTGGRCTHWEPFSLTQLLPWYLCLYKLCELNWLHGFHVDAMLKKHLRFLFAFVREKPIDFGQLAYDQIIEMSRQSDADKKIVLPNLIYQTLNLQRDILALPGDEPLIGQPQNVSGLEADLSLRRGRRGRIHSDD
ncbi:hypothetical protein F2Q69_00031056 [Brassica cretica]|uniref:Uncharacterized protein n=1 Tax=Brassica cretica TaxID=69181 RepID=A0A8S9RSS4_BRACR|nr:hypothetical protein F2Q69_00031056 [Brassica cretica]